MTNKKLLLVLIIAVLAVTSLGTAKAQNPVTITYWRAGGAGGTLGADEQKIINTFQEKNPDIKVNVEMVPFAEYDQKSQTVMTAKEGPDVLEVNSVTIGLFVQRGLLMPIDDLLKSSSIKADQFYKGAWASTNIKGKIWGLPLDTGTRLVLWNKKLFQDAGVKPFGETVTWDELLAAAKAINAPDK
ncbi:MAG: extracellular solute-binding protein, partial [Anaerolineae bacterium]|nr:extracellular solute-binding protein [Anaerolineae bacterium]